ncbi:MAG TPA: DUF4070 domain-containing protein, partial [Anaerolineae bacterium]|nr:DUF4070 domain-containing protein [Anaerolineae bacterium]
IRTFLREYHPPKVNVPIDRTGIAALFRSIYRLGILGQERVQYWRLFFWTLFSRPRLFPVAITLAVYGYHFRIICEQHVG